MDYEGINNISNVRFIYRLAVEMYIYEIYIFFYFKENQIGPMQEPFLLVFVINKGTDHPAQSDQCLCLWLICKYPI